ncbi:MAG: hypothetical protein V2I33_26520, partial [Kangiellaceae bacterium]|nr:hypothetical protein [Kangiellaceae bacterium]
SSAISADASGVATASKTVKLERSQEKLSSSHEHILFGIFSGDCAGAVDDRVWVNVVFSATVDSLHQLLPIFFV